jgi:hypothetical protein
MFQVTIRTLRKACCRGGDACDGDVDAGLCPSVDRWAESGPCGRSACRRVNRAVQSVIMSAKLLVFVALKGAPGRDEPASGDNGRLVVGTRCMRDVERCRVGVRQCRSAWIRNQVGYRSEVRLIISRYRQTMAGSNLSFHIHIHHGSTVTDPFTTPVSEDGIHNATANSSTCKDQFKSTLLSVDARECTDLRRSPRRQQQMSRAVLIIIKTDLVTFKHQELTSRPMPPIREGLAGWAGGACWTTTCCGGN